MIGVELVRAVVFGIAGVQFQLPLDVALIGDRDFEIVERVEERGCGALGVHFHLQAVERLHDQHGLRNADFAGLHRHDAHQKRIRAGAVFAAARHFELIRSETVAPGATLTAETGMLYHSMSMPSTSSSRRSGVSCWLVMVTTRRVALPGSIARSG